MRRTLWLGLVFSTLALAATPALAYTPLWIFNGTPQPVTLYLDGTQVCALNPASNDIGAGDSCTMHVEDGDHTVGAVLNDGTHYSMSYHAPGSNLHATIDSDGLHAWTPDY
jgi:hypothetical protein